MALYLPKAHCVQFTSPRKPTLFWYFPASQFMHDPDSASEYCPFEQLVHPLDRSMLPVPAGQMYSRGYPNL